MSKLDDIKARWAKATKGPWQPVPKFSALRDDEWSICDIGEMSVRSSSRDTPLPLAIDDAVAIASAPADIAWLVARVEELEAYGMAKNDLVEQLVREVDAPKGGGNG